MKENNMSSKDALVVFKGAKIRRTWHDDQWFFSVVDIIRILTESGSPRQYWGVLKKEPKIRRIVESSSDILRGMEECDK